MGYYGAYVDEPVNRHVLCHAIRVEEYTRTLPNGKTITVKGYSRQGNPAIEQERSNRNQRYDTARSDYVSTARQQARNAGISARTAVSTRYSKLTPQGRLIYAGSAARYAGSSASNYARAGATAARQAYENARDMASDFAETAQVGISNFMEEVRYGAAYAGAAASEAAKKVAARAKKAYDAGKSFIEKLFGRVKEVAGNVGKAVSGAYNQARSAAKTAYNDIFGRKNPSRKDPMKGRATTNGRAGGGGSRRMATR